MRSERRLMISLVALFLVAGSLLYTGAHAQYYYYRLNSDNLVQVKLYKFDDGSSKLIMKEKVDDEDLKDVQEYVNGIRVDEDKIIAYGKIVAKKYVEREFGESDTVFKLEVEASGSDKTIKIEKFYFYVENTETKDTFKVELEGTITVKYSTSQIEVQGGTITISSTTSLEDISQVLKELSKSSEKFDITMEENTTNRIKFKINSIIISMGDALSYLDISSGAQFSDLIDKIHLSSLKIQLDTSQGLFTYRLEIGGDIAGLAKSNPLIKSSIIEAIGDYVITYDVSPNAKKVWYEYEDAILDEKNLDLSVPTYAITYYWASNSTSLVAFPRVTLTNGSDTSEYLKNMLTQMGAPSNMVSVETAKSEEDLVKLPSELSGSWLGDAIYIIVIGGILAGALAFLLLLYKKFS